MASKFPVSTLVAGMFITGCANSLLSKYQDMECVENCSPNSKGHRVDFEQPVWQTLNMFIGEFLCILPLIYTHYTTVPKHPTLRGGTSTPPAASMFTRILQRLPLGTGSQTVPDGYDAIDGNGDEEDEDDDGEGSRRGGGDDGVRGERLEGWKMGLMWFPAFFDICGTTLMNVGLILTPVSIYQMSRGALVLWVGILSVLFLRRRLYIYQWFSLIVVMLGVCVVGLSGSLIKKTITEDGGGVGLVVKRVFEDGVGRVGLVVRGGGDDPARVAVGVMLILFAQIFTATQYVVEEKIMSRYHVDPLAAVTLEGLFGGLTTLLSMPFLHHFLRTKSTYFDIPRGWHQIISTPSVYWSCIAIMFSIGSFNFFGLSVTTRVSATTRSTVDTCRTLGIWVVSLGLGWEVLVWPFSLLQVGGFGMLVYGTFVFNGLLPPPFGRPPLIVHLPREPELEETGGVPAASAQGRAGYDVLPTDG